MRIDKTKLIIKTGIMIMILTCAVNTNTQATVSPQIGETWMGIYFNTAKIGYSKMKITKAAYKNKPAFKLDTLSVTKMMVLGEQVEQTVESSVFLDKKSAPLYQIFQMSSAGHKTKIKAVYLPKEISVQIESDGTRGTKSIPIPDGSILVGDSTYFSPTISIRIGDVTDLKCFNPLTLSLDDIQTNVLRKESIEINGKSYDAYVILSKTPIGEMTCWQANNGDLLKVVALMGISMIMEPKNIAMSMQPQMDAYMPTDDLAVMTSAQTNIDIPEPRKVNKLLIRFHGMKEKSFAITDSRQTASFSDGEVPYAEYEISAALQDYAKSVSLPITDKSLTKYLEDTPYIQPSNPEIKKIAEEIVGGEKNAWKAASKIRAWIYANMHTKGNIGILRSSVDVLHAKEGVCRDYAILCASIARSAGIPSKVAAGLIYWRNGFYYHAWTEVYIGKWVPIDSTLAVDFVDATHIKLSEGEATDMFCSIRTMGSLKAEVISFKHLADE